MAVFDAVAFGDMLKRVYGPNVISQVSDKVLLRKEIATSTDEWTGSEVRFPIALGRAQSFMAHGALGILPTPVNETFTSTVIPVKWMHGRIQLGVDAMKQSMTNRGAFARALNFIMDRLVTNIADDLNRIMASGTGRGIFALADDTSSVGNVGDPIQVDSPMGIASPVYGTRFLQPGMLIAFTDGTTLKNIRTITSLSESGTQGNSTIVLDNVVVYNTGYTNNDFIVRAASPTITNLTRDTSLDNEPMGLEGIVDDGTLVANFQAVQRGTYTDWQATRLVVSALSLDALQRLFDTIDQQSGETPTHNVVHHSIRRAYLSAADSARTFMQTGRGPQMFDIGQEPMGMQLTYNGIPILSDKDVTLGNWLAVNNNHLTRFVLVEGEWIDEDGAVLVRLTDQDAFEATYRIAENTATDKCNSHGKIVGMSTTNAIGRHVV